MKKCIIFLLILFVSIAGFAQRTSSKKNVGSSRSNAKAPKDTVIKRETYIVRERIVKDTIKINPDDSTTNNEPKNQEPKDTTPNPGDINTGKPDIPSTNNGTENSNQDPANSDGEEESAWKDQFNALINYNFAGNNKGLSNLTPIIHLGNEWSLVDINDKSSWSVDLDPYVGSQIDTKDSASLIPALMLYGNGGLMFNNYLKFGIGNSQLTLAPFNFGIKFLSNFLDSGNLIIQHNIRIGMAYSYMDNFMLGFQFTQGWHNISSESERFYKKVFSRDKTNISYLTATLQVKLSDKLLAKTSNDEDVSKKWYAYFEWRNLLSKDAYPGFTNNRIFTIGLRKDFGLRNVFYAAERKKKYEAARKRRMQTQ